MPSNNRPYTSFAYLLLSALLLFGFATSSCSSDTDSTANASSQPDYTPLHQDNPGGDPAILPFEGDSLYTIDLDRWDIDNTGKNPDATTESIQASIDWAVGNGYNVIKLITIELSHY